MAGFIGSQRETHRIPAAVACRALGVCRSWYYKWRGGALPPSAERRRRLAAEIRRLFELHEGKLHLVSVLDMGSRRVLGFALSGRHTAELAYGALAMAVAVRGGRAPGVVFHTDQGSELRFKGSSQRRCFGSIVGVHSALRRVSSRRVSCGAGC